MNDYRLLILFPFRSQPLRTDDYIRGPRYRVMFDRISPSRAASDTHDLRLWVMDVLQCDSDAREQLRLLQDSQ